MNRSVLLGMLNPYQGKKILVINDQDTSDIISEMKRAHKLHAREYDRIANFFWTGNISTTCEKIFKFLKKNVHYSIEPDTRQSVKSPAAILASGANKNGYNDCKHYSLFTAGILDSLRRQGKNINWAFRFANYRLFQSTPHHVFVVCFDGRKEIWIDAVLPNFNEKKTYQNKVDVMALYNISGIDQIGCPGTNCSCRKRKPVSQAITYMGGMDVIAGKAKRRARKAKRRADRAAGYCKGKLAKKVVLAPARNAFLALVGLNVKKTAVKLYGKLQNPESKKKLLNKWCRLGGTARKLENTILKAYRKYARKRKISGYDEPEMIGAPITALLATAGPILLALKEFLGKAQEIKESAQNLFSRGGGGGSSDQEFEPMETMEPDEPGEIGFLGFNTGDFVAMSVIALAVFKSTKNKA